MWSCNTIKSEVYNCLMPYQKVDFDDSLNDSKNLLF